MASGLIGQVVYVDIDAVGNNDGTSWANAYTDLSIAIDSSGAGSEIWVAEGTYIPGGQIPTRGSSFVIENDIRLYGGFNGTEDNLSQRNILANRTILSGDINGDDIEGDFVNFRSENCRHVVFVAPGVSNGCVIDGFTVSGGHTDGQTAAGDDRRAGAILMYGAPIIRNCVFTANYGHFAGAVYPRAAASTGAQILNCRFQGNLGGFGGAMYVVTNDDIVIRDCIFEENEADGRGGAVYNSGFSTTFDNCQFLNNTAGSSGGVYHNLIDETDFSSVEFRGCAFIGNRGNFGGAISLYGNGTSLVDSCMFDQNMADAGGGALSIGFTNISMISNSVFSNNEADRGGAIWQQNDTTSVTIKNCDFSTNLCFGSNGGAIYQRGSASLRISDTRFEGNQANFGGAIFMFEDSVDISTLVVERCFFNFNVAEQQAGGINISNSDVYISNCLLANGIVSSG
ncbi:MAG: hypothetical protein R3275_13115, partial [Saprospiraceae bacterium]|nr:hypothetical protein [Saprospiraceae bacterium]